MKSALFTLIIFVALSFILLRLAGWYSYKSGPKSVVTPETFGDLPTTPNVATSSLTFASEQEQVSAWTALQAVIEDLGRTSKVSGTSEFLHYTARTPICGWTDDVYLLKAEGESTIQLRSQSRVGHSDLGANRKRLDEILEKADLSAD